MKKYQVYHVCCRLIEYFINQKCFNIKYGGKVIDMIFSKINHEHLIQNTSQQNLTLCQGFKQIFQNYMKLPILISKILSTFLYVSYKNVL